MRLNEFDKIDSETCRSFQDELIVDKWIAFVDHPSGVCHPESRHETFAAPFTLAGA